MSTAEQKLLICMISAMALASCQGVTQRQKKKEGETAPVSTNNGRSATETDDVYGFSDLDADGMVTASELDTIFQNLSTESGYGLVDFDVGRFDLNKDGITDALDFDAFLTATFGPETPFSPALLLEFREERIRQVAGGNDVTYLSLLSALNSVKVTKNQDLLQLFDVDQVDGLTPSDAIAVVQESSTGLIPSGDFDLDARYGDILFRPDTDWQSGVQTMLVMRDVVYNIMASAMYDGIYLETYDFTDDGKITPIDMLSFADWIRGWREQFFSRRELSKMTCTQTIDLVSSDVNAVVSAEDIATAKATVVSLQGLTAEVDGFDQNYDCNNDDVIDSNDTELFNETAQELEAIFKL